MVGVGDVHARGARLVQLLAVAGDGVREVDDVQDLGSTELGDLHGLHAVRHWAVPGGAIGQARMLVWRSGSANPVGIRDQPVRRGAAASTGGVTSR